MKTHSKGMSVPRTSAASNGAHRFPHGTGINPSNNPGSLWRLMIVQHPQDKITELMCRLLQFVLFALFRRTFAGSTIVRAFGESLARHAPLTENEEL